MSKSNRKINSKDVQSILGKTELLDFLFYQKNNDEGLDFYYMGEVNPELNQVEQTTMKMIVANRFQLSKFVSI
jgi:hypothetical protein